MTESWQGAESSLADAEERRVLFAALDSFRYCFFASQLDWKESHWPNRQYRRVTHLNFTHRKRQNFYALPTHHWQMLAKPPFNILSKLDQVDDAIDANAEISSRILEAGLAAFGVSTDPSPGEPDWKEAAKPADIDKANTTIRQFYRDWSQEGAAERAAHFHPVLDDLVRLFKAESDKGKIHVLVPGAGLGRLVFEICKAGFRTEGNEISFHALMASNWVLNRLEPNEKFDLYPSALSFSNQPDCRAQLSKVQIPDVHPATELELASQGMQTHAFERLGMSAADFLLAYSDDQHREHFDAVVTVFFIDTAPNVVRYIETIHHTLKDGGYWINLGPLKWHFEAGHNAHFDNAEADQKESRDSRRGNGIGEPGSVELTNEELLLLVENMGLDMEFSEVRTDGLGYIQDLTSMSQNAYRVSHFVARKAVR